MVASNTRLPQQGDSIGLETNTEDKEQNDQNVNLPKAKINSVMIFSVSDRHCEYQNKNIIITQETINHNDIVLSLSLATRQSTALKNESVHDDKEQTNKDDKQPRNMKNGNILPNVAINMHNPTLVPGKMSANNLTLRYVLPASLGSAEQPAAIESADDPNESPELVPEREESREQVTAYQREAEECEAPVSLGPQQTESSSKDSKSRDGQPRDQYLPDTLTAIGTVLTMLWGALIAQSYFIYLLAVFVAVVIYDMIPPAINAGRSGKEEAETAEAEGRTDKCRARGHSYKHQETDMNDGGPTSTEMKPVPLSDGVLSPSVTPALARRSPGPPDLETTFDLNLNEMQSLREFPLKDKAYRLGHTASWVCAVIVVTPPSWVDLVWRSAIIMIQSGVNPGVKKGKRYVDTPVKELHAPFFHEDATGRDTDGLVLLTPSTDDTDIMKDTQNDTALNPKQRVPYTTEPSLKLGFVKATPDAKILVTIIVFLGSANARYKPQTPVTLSVFLAILSLMCPWRDYATKRDSDQDEEHDDRLALDDQCRGGRSASPPSTLRDTHIKSLRKDVSGETNDGGTGNNSNEKNGGDNTSNGSTGQQKQSSGRRNSDSDGEGSGGGRAASSGSGDGRDDDDDDDNPNHRNRKTKDDAEDEAKIDNEDDDGSAEDDETPQSDDQAEAVKEKSVDAVPATIRLLSLPQLMWSESLTSRARVVQILRYFQHCLTLREEIYGAPMPNAFSGILLRTNPRGIILQGIHSFEYCCMKSVNPKRLSRRSLRARYQGDGRVASYLVLTTITPWARAITFVFRLPRAEGGYVLLICRAEQNQLQPASSRNSETVIVAVCMILDTREKPDAPREMLAFRSHAKYMIALSMMYNVPTVNYFIAVAFEHLGTPAATDPFVLNIQRGFMTALGMMNYTNMGPGQTRIQSVPTMGVAMLVVTLMPRMNGSEATSTNPFQRLFPWNVFATFRPALTQGSDVLPFVSDTVITNRPANGPAAASSFQRNSNQGYSEADSGLGATRGMTRCPGPGTVSTDRLCIFTPKAQGEARSRRSYGRETTSTGRREGGDHPAVQPETVEPATTPPHSCYPRWMHIGTGLTLRRLSCHKDGRSDCTGRAEDTRNLPPKLPPEAETAQVREANEGHPVQCEADVRSRTTTVPVPDEEDGESSGAEGAPDWGYNVAPHRPRLVDVPAPARLFVKERFTLVATCEDDSLENRLKQLEAENRRLRDRYMCGCCGHKMFNILLQPCQHMVCDVCFTRHWPRCPFCYSPIEQHVNISFA